MGGGASADKKAAAFKDMDKGDVEDVLGKLDQGDLKNLQAMVAKAQADAAKEAAKAKRKPKVAKAHNVEAATDMDCAIFAWDFDALYDALCASDAKDMANKLPMGIEGWGLLLDYGDLLKGDDKKKWEDLVPKAAVEFFADQAEAKVPYLPPKIAKPHAVYHWSAAQVEKRMKKGGVELKGKSGKELMAKGPEGLAGLSDDDKKKATEIFQKHGEKFMEAMAKFMKKQEEEDGEEDDSD